MIFLTDFSDLYLLRSSRKVNLKNVNFVVLVRLMDTGISYYIWKYDDLAAKLQSRFGPNPTSDKLNLTEKDFDNHELAQAVDNWEALGF
jgi:hypothetical protein